MYCYHPHRGNECGEVTVIWAEGDAEVSIAVEDGLLCGNRNRTYLKKRTLCVVGSLPGMKVECLEVHCQPGFAIFLSTYYHVAEPGHGLTH